jgi:hypothetical protein
VSSFRLSMIGAKFGMYEKATRCCGRGFGAFGPGLFIDPLQRTPLRPDGFSEIEILGAVPQRGRLRQSVFFVFESRHQVKTMRLPSQLRRCKSPRARQEACAGVAQRAAESRARRAGGGYLPDPKDAYDDSERPVRNP